MLNKVFLIGNVVRDPDIRTTAGDRPTTIARYTIAVNRRKTREGTDPGADFISCVAFDKNAEFAEKYLRKGIKIAVVGYIRTGSYTNKDGQTVYTTDIIVNECEFCESKNAAQATAENPAPSANPAASPSDVFVSANTIDDSELPFGG